MGDFNKQAAQSRVSAPPEILRGRLFSAIRTIDAATLIKSYHPCEVLGGDAEGFTALRAPRGSGQATVHEPGCPVSMYADVAEIRVPFFLRAQFDKGRASHEADRLQELFTDEPGILPVGNSGAQNPHLP